MTGWPGILLCFAALAALLIWSDAGPASGLRHFLLLPALWAGLRFGGLGGGGGGLLAALLYAPFVLPAIERGGLTGEAVEGLVSLAGFLFAGGVTGTLARRAQTRADRFALLLRLQRTLTNGTALPEVLVDVAEELRIAFGARSLGIVLIEEGSGPLVVTRGDAAPGAVDARSAVAWVVRTGAPLFLSDAEGDRRLGPPRRPAGRPCRALLLPLGAREGCTGVLVVQRRGEFPRELRAAAETLGLQLALGIDNARLAERRRRSAGELEAKVADATHRLRELDRAKSDFVSIVSHELRTPLTSIQGFSELLLTRPPSGDGARRCLEAIHREAERLGRIVADLLDLSRIESGRERALRLAPLRLGPLIDANAELFRAQSPGHAIDREVPEALPPVLADHDALDRVLKNLLSNAIKYSPGGGPVRIWARRAPEAPGRVELGVEDRGVGIPAEALSRIFDRYARLPHPGTAHVRGLGLGLALVKALVEAQDGRVRVESEPGRGSCFIVSLPIA